MWAEYTEPPAPSSYLRVFDPCGRQVDHGDSQATAYRLTVSVSAATSGTYRVDWAVLSAFDGHLTRGMFTFTSAGGESCPGAGEQYQAGEEDDPRDEGGGAPAGDESATTTSGAPGDERPRSRTANGRGRGSRPSSAAAPSDETRGRNRSADDPVLAFEGAPEEPATEERREAPSDFPTDGLIVSFVLTALIGAAGGHVYAGIMGPKR